MTESALALLIAREAIGKIPIESKEIQMPTRNVVLTDHQANVLEQLVSSGRYQNAGGEALNDGPEILGSKTRDEIGMGIRTLHVARHGPKGRHFVMLRVSGEGVLDVLRLLHDSMNLARYLPAANDLTQ